jgi:hypothetical protein
MMTVMNDECNDVWVCDAMRHFVFSPFGGIDFSTQTNKIESSFSPIGWRTDGYPKPRFWGFGFPKLINQITITKLYDRKSDDDDLRIETSQQRVTNAIINRSCCQ